MSIYRGPVQLIRFFSMFVVIQVANVRASNQALVL